MDHSHLLSNTVQLYKPGLVGIFGQIAKGFPDPIILAGGIPNPILFPFKNMTITTRDGREIIIDESLMAECQQYGTAMGHGPLMEQLRTLTKRLHDPPRWREREILVLPGSQMGISLALKMLVNPEDFVIFDEPVYYGVLASLQFLRHQVATVKCDSDGMRPDDLEEVLENCRSSSKGKPKVLCVNPSGKNPSGVVYSETRRRLIYEIACRHDLIILEDDPYYLLEFGETLSTSFLRLDTDGRVIRLDSFSKIVSAGIRLGYATGPKGLIDKMRLLLISSVIHTSLVGQVCVSKWLDTVGIDGFLENAKGTAKFYKDRRNLAVKAAEKHLKGLCEWNVPAGGMYLWLKVTDVADTKKLTLVRGPEKGVLALPGLAFFVHQDRPTPFLRLSYAGIDPHKVDEGFKMLAEAIREEMKEEKRRTSLQPLAARYRLLFSTMDYSRFFASIMSKVDSHGIWNELDRINNPEKPAPFEMLYGKPNPATFPFVKAKVTLKNDQIFDINPEVMAVLQQYCNVSGYRPLVQHIRALTERVHDPPLWGDRKVIVTTGALNALSKIFEMLLDEGDTVFVPMNCYQGVNAAGAPLQPNFSSIQTDRGGIVPDSLQQALIDCQKSKGVPKFLYVNPGGSNPDGTVLSESRRRRIYDLACQHDILIVEDDPYYFLQFCDEVPSSFLQLDTEGRVLRLESFSKTLGGGLRLGFAIIPNHFAPTLSILFQESIMHTSMFPQVLASRLFDTWGLDGYLKETERTREFYRKQRDMALQAAEKHLKGLCEWTTPLGGFFLWLKVPKLKDTRNLLLECGRERGVVLVPGCGFLADHSKPSQFMRASYSKADGKDLDKAFRILAEAIREEIKKEESK
ncbi:uncharacterized protein LOC135225101 [Macrobrachium nipponense]|uniref:uncharacterized protein LOC135225101 n=1 Tax=Macrobrachium nipponense TaxID=159736 RepID=UPI0030C81306